MTRTSTTLIQAALLLLLLMSTQACASLSPPFDKMKDQQMTVFHLQNYEPPQAPVAAPGAAPGALGIPPQITQWATQTAQSLGLGSLIPPGLVPGAAPPPPAMNVPHFHDFRILRTQQVTDSSTRSDIVDVFGHESNFTEKYESCFFPEFGFAIAQPNGPTADILVSFSCQQVRAFNINWPYSKIGIPPDTQKKLAAIVSKVFGS